MTATVRETVHVGVIDSGWRAPAPDQRVRRGRTFFAHADPLKPNLSAGSIDLIGHGTRCTKLILAVAPTVSITPLRIFERRLETSPEVLCAALEFATTQSLDVLSLSLSTVREDARDRLHDLCDDIQGAGTIIVASARNGYLDGYPAVFSGVIGVGIGQGGLDGRALYKTGGVVDIIAKQGWIGRPLIHGVHSPLTTTSAAGAFVAGCIAQVIATSGPVPRSELLDRIEELYGFKTC